MPISVTQVLAPNGRIEPSWFPSEGDGSLGTPLYARLDAYAVQAETRAPGNGDAQEEWIYFRAFDAACQQMNANPATADLATGGSHGFAVDQRRWVCDEAIRLRAEFEASVAIDTVVAAPRRPVSRINHARVVW